MARKKDTQRTQITWVTDIQQGLALLYQERVDGLDLEYFVSQRSAPLSYEQDAFTLDLTLPHNEIPFSLSTLYHQDIISELNKFISSNPELIDSIKTKYGITPFEQLSQKLLIEQGLKIEGFGNSIRRFVQMAVLPVTCTLSSPLFQPTPIS